MKLLTWNLNGLDDTRLDERTEAAVFLAVTGCTLRQLAAGKTSHRAPDVLVLQEVVKRSFEAHLRVHLPRAGYVLYPSVAPGRAVFEVIAVRKPATISTATTVPLEHSLNGRCLHIVEVEGVAGINRGIRVLTAHFDSGPTEGLVRVSAGRQVLAAMDGRSIFAGDTNMRDSEWGQIEAAGDHNRVSDAWDTVGRPHNLKRTWRMHGRSARFDRIWLGADVHATAMTCIGDMPVPGLTDGRAGLTDGLAGLTDGPSDHIGLIVEVADQRAKLT